MDASGQAANDISRVFITPNPSRSEATGSDYQAPLSSGLISMQIHDTSGTTDISNARQGNNRNPIINNIYFLDRGDITNLGMNSAIHFIVRRMVMEI